MLRADGPPADWPREQRVWGQWIADPAAPATLEPHDVEAALAALHAWTGLQPPGPFDVVLDRCLVVPLAWPTLPRALVILPGGPGAVTRADLIHELAHLVLFAPGSLLFSEGWAVACGCMLATDTRFPFTIRGPDELHAHALRATGDTWRLTDYLRGAARAADLAVQGMPAEHNQLAYARAGSFVCWLVATRGVAQLIQLVRSLSTQSAVPEADAVSQVYGVALESLELQWREAVAPAAEVGPPAVAADASRPCLAPAGPWLMYTDESVRGNSTGSFTETAGAVRVTGRVGTRGAWQFLAAYRHLRPDRSRVDVTDLRGLRFEARGDGKNYQLWIATEATREPGKEFMYLFSTQDEWMSHEVPFTRLQRFAADELTWTGKQVAALGIRVFGYRGQPVAFEVRHLELYA